MPGTPGGRGSGGGRDPVYSLALVLTLLGALLLVAWRSPHLDRAAPLSSSTGGGALRVRTSSLLYAAPVAPQPPPAAAVLQSASEREEGPCQPPVLDWARLLEHNCVLREKVCVDQNRFITFDKRLQPGREYVEGAKLFDFGWTFTNVPGWADNIKGTKRLYHPLLAQPNSSHDPADILHPYFQKCQVPLIWWPFFAFNAADVYLSSLLPLLRLQQEGAVDEGIRFVPAMDGWSLPPHMRDFFQPFSRHEVVGLEDLSARTQAGRRCFESVLLCHPHNFWFQPLTLAQRWDHGFRPKAVAAEILRYHLDRRRVPLERPSEGLLAPSPAPDLGTVQVTFIRRSMRKLLDLDTLLRRCAEQPLVIGGRAVRCSAVRFEEGGPPFAALLEQLQHTNILVGVHGAGLINHVFLPPNASAFLEVFPCRFGSAHQDTYFLRPALQENLTLAFQMHLADEASCRPSELQSHPEALNYQEGLAFVQSTLARDQDVVLGWDRVLAALRRMVPLLGRPEEYSTRLLEDPKYYDIPVDG